MGRINDVLERLNEDADRDLGAIVLVLDAMEEHEQADFMASCELQYWFETEWGDGMGVYPVLEMDAAVKALITDRTLTVAEDQCRDLNQDWFVRVGEMRTRVMRPGDDWREARQAARDAGNRTTHNQGNRKSVASIHRKDRLNFDSQAEITVYEALLRKQASLPPEVTIGILPGPGARVLGRTFYPDLVVTHRGRVGMIEVDGPHHTKRAAADHSRDSLLSDAGITLVERIVVEDTTDPNEVDAFIERFLQRLLR